MVGINQKMDQEGESYLFILRLVPLFPFFLVNICMGLTDIKFLKYFFISWIGMLPGVFLYINAGEKIASLSSAKDIFDFKIVLSLSLVGIFPWLTGSQFLKCRCLDTQGTCLLGLSV